MTYLPHLIAILVCSFVGVVMIMRR